MYHIGVSLMTDICVFAHLRFIKKIKTDYYMQVLQYAKALYVVFVVFSPICVFSKFH